VAVAVAQKAVASVITASKTLFCTIPEFAGLPEFFFQNGAGRGFRNWLL